MMSEFFNGWQRKAGVATMLLACVFVAGWVRSLFFNDMLICSNGQIPTNWLSSVDSSLVWAIDYNPNFGKRPYYNCSPISEVGSRLFEVPYVKWRWRWCGFGFGVTNESSELLSEPVLKLRKR